MPASTEHAARLTRFQDAIAARGLDGALLLHAVDVLYLSATRQNGALWVPARGAPVLLVRKSLARAKAETAVADARPFPSSKDLAAVLGSPAKLGTTFDAVPAATLDFWRKNVPGEWTDVSGLLREQRSVKSEAELEVMRDGGARIASVLREVPSFLRPGMTELEVTAEIEARLRRAGNEGSPRLRAFNAELFVGLAVAGDAAAEPGYFDGPVVGRGLGAAYPLGASRRAVKAGEPVLLDYTGVFGGYVMDMTRVAVCGALDADLADAHRVARAIQDELVRGLVPGASCLALWERAKAIADEAGLGDRFMGPPGDQARFVGHGVGLELDELPVLAAGAKSALVAGQTIAIEPKFVFPGRGAVGIENTWAVTERGGEKLTPLADDVLVAPAA